MKPGDLRRFKDSLIARRYRAGVEGSTFMVLRVDPTTRWPAPPRCVDILINGHVDEGLRYFWVEDSSELLEPVQPTQEVVY